MNGFPKTLSTKEDYEYIRQNFPEEQWKPAWQALLDERKNWFKTGDLEKEEDGIVDELHKVESEPDMTDPTGKKRKYYQMELQTDPNCRLKQLGFTVSEVEKALGLKK